MSDNPPAVPRRTTSYPLSKWANTNLAPNSQGQVSLPQGSQISQVVTPVTRSGSEYPPSPPETRPHRPPRQRAIVTPSDARLVTSPPDGAQTQVAVVAPSLTKADDGQVSIRQLGDTEASGFEPQTPTDADKVSIAPQQTPVPQSTGVDLQSQKSPYENSLADQGVQNEVQTCCAEVQTDAELQSQWDSNKALSFGHGVQTKVRTCCAEVQTDAELQSQRNPNGTVGIGRGVQTRGVQTCCVEVQTDVDTRPLRADAVTVAAEMPSTERTQSARVTQSTIPSVPSVLSDEVSSTASSVGGGQAFSRIPLRIRASQSSGGSSSVSARPIESPRSADGGSSEFSVDSAGDNSQPGRHEIHHHHHHHHYHYQTHNYSHCTVIQRNANPPPGVEINEEVEEQQYADD